MDIDKIINEYKKTYIKILCEMYPAKNSTGFPERNLSVNFSKAYEKIMGQDDKDIVTWYEFQFGKKNNHHVDAIMLDKNNNSIFIMESKRFSNLPKKIYEVGQDINRIKELLEELKEENQKGIKRIDLSNYKNYYGVILADVWTETDFKKDILKSFQDGMNYGTSERAFLNKYNKELGNIKIENDIHYYVANLGEIKDLEKYNLLVMIWKL